MHTSTTTAVKLLQAEQRSLEFTFQNALFTHFLVEERSTLHIKARGVGLEC